MYKPENFEIYELVSQYMYERWGERCWSLLDERMLRGLQVYRDQFGPLVVNDWYWGGDYEQRGLRTFDFWLVDEEPVEYALEMYAASRSQHKYGRAVDFHSKAYTAEEMREWTYTTPRTVYFTGIEDFNGMSWFHGDIRNQAPNTTSGFYVFDG